MYKSCVHCNRTYSEERWRTLALHSFHAFAPDFIELRVCVCKKLVGKEHSVLSYSEAIILPYKPNVEFTGGTDVNIAIRSNKRRRY